MAFSASLLTYQAFGNEANRRPNIGIMFGHVAIQTEGRFYRDRCGKEGEGKEEKKNVLPKIIVI